MYIRNLYDVLIRKTYQTANSNENSKFGFTIICNTENLYYIKHKFMWVDRCEMLLL